MAWNPARVRRHLQNRTFPQLFIEELGWDNLRERLPVDVDGDRYWLEPVAHKRGVVAFVHRAGDELPDNRVRRKIETQVARSHREHVIIYTDGPGNQQVWQWVRREPGKPLSNREHRFDSQQSGESLIQKLEAIRFSLDEEDDLTLTDVVGSVRAAFNVERATKKFYTEFKREHDAFQKFLQGIPDGEMERWYVSVMLNRLMFLYFIQKKGFLAEDRDYLRSKLSASQSRGEDRYYRDFLCPLFFEGFAKAKEQRTPAINALLGDIPYLNGGIFQQHQVEQLHGQTIAIPDRAFDRLFDFFDNYQWHLDDRPLRDDREINPDVLGYIFEQYINQKQMGAYYTKEDITDYIGKNTILPFLCDRAQKEYPDGFRGPNGAWMLLQRDPARYIYPAVAKGVELPLPAEISAGIADVGQRGAWNTPTPEEFALPTEIWRETVARRQRYAEVQGKLEGGEVQSINDLITLNLDIRQFVQDVIEQSERPETVRAFWKALTGVSVLDPTCGSGAFHFAALNILEPLYEACLTRMQAFVEESGPQESPLRFKDFRTELAQMARHPNQKYFVYKSIVVNNLYGVDLMAEATEIAKLRLFLKLVAQVDEVAKLEPLPDIDFNIRAGNTLVGFATYADVEETVRGDRLLLLPEDEELLAEIREEAEAVERLFGRFRRMQTGHDVSEWGEDYATTKAILTQRLQVLDERLNRLLAQQYGIDPDKLEYEGWRSSHQPFHWFVEFYGILKAGGFDVVIGNPPWVEYRRVNQIYSILAYATEKCGNLWAFVTERSLQLLHANGRAGLIVPMSLASSQRMQPMQRMLLSNGIAWVSNYESDSNPGQLFSGVKQNVSIIIYQTTNVPRIFTSRFVRFFSDARDYVFPTLELVELLDNHLEYGLAKIGNTIEREILQKLFSHVSLVARMSDKSNNTAFVHRIAHYYIKCFDFIPYFKSDRDGEKKSEDYWEYRFKGDAAPYVASINSSTFYFYWQAFFDGFKAGRYAVQSFPFPTVSENGIRILGELCTNLMEDMKKNSTRLLARYSRTGNVEYDQFTPRLSKPIIDQIDSVLAGHYGFSDEELDYIINYDIKYRMGDELFSEEEGEE